MQQCFMIVLMPYSLLKISLTLNGSREFRLENFCKQLSNFGTKYVIISICIYCFKCFRESELARPKYK